MGSRSGSVVRGAGAALAAMVVLLGVLRALGVLGSDLLAGPVVGREPGPAPGPAVDVVAAPPEPGRDIVERVARAQAQGGRAEIRRHYTPRQAARCAASPERCSVYDALVVRERTAAVLAERYPGRFTYRRTGVDFEDRLTGERIELTTKGRFCPHLSRTGEYRTVRFAIYRIPLRRTGSPEAVRGGSR